MILKVNIEIQFTQGCIQYGDRDQIGFSFCDKEYHETVPQR